MRIWIAFFLALACAPLGHAEQSVAACTTTATPCLSWTVDLPGNVYGLPSVVFPRCWDCDAAAEGDLSINGTLLPLFGAANPAGDRVELARVSMETLRDPWVFGGTNQLRVTWRTNQSPTVHDLRGGIIVEYATRKPPPPPGVVVKAFPGQQGGGQRFLIGFADTESVRIVETILTPAQKSTLLPIMVGYFNYTETPSIDLPFSVVDDAQRCSNARLLWPLFTATGCE